MSGSDATKPGAGVIPGYDYGTNRSAVSPVTEEELRHLEEAAGWSTVEAALLRKHEAELDGDDLAHMRKVVGYVHRHLAQRPAGDVRHTRWRWSLMNWGHDPLEP